MHWGILLPWRHRQAMRQNTKDEKTKTDDVCENVIKPLREKRRRITDNHLAQYAAEGLGIIRRSE